MGPLLRATGMLSPLLLTITGYAASAVLGRGVGAAVLVAQRPPPAGQPEAPPARGQAQQVAPAGKHYRQWRAGVINDVAPLVDGLIEWNASDQWPKTMDQFVGKAPGIGQEDLNSTLKDFVRKQAHAALQEIGKVGTTFHDVIKVEKAGDTPMFNNAELPSVMLELKQLKRLGVGVSVEPKLADPFLQNDNTEKSFLVIWTVTLEVDGETFGFPREVKARMNFAAPTSTVLKAAEGQVLDGDADAAEVGGRTDETNTFHLSLPPEKAEWLRALVGEDLVRQSDPIARLWHMGEGAFGVNVVFQFSGVGNRYRIEHHRGDDSKRATREPDTAAGEYVARGKVEMHTPKGAAAVDYEVYMAPLAPKEAVKEAKIVPAKARVVWSAVRPIQKSWPEGANR